MKSKCDHFWDFMDKWQDEENEYWEFYCKNCLEIQVRKLKKRSD